MFIKNIMRIERERERKERERKKERKYLWPVEDHLSCRLGNWNYIYMINIQGEWRSISSLVWKLSWIINPPKSEFSIFLLFLIHENPRNHLEGRRIALNKRKWSILAIPHILTYIFRKPEHKKQKSCNKSESKFKTYSGNSLIPKNKWPSFKKMPLPTVKIFYPSNKKFEFHTFSDPGVFVGFRSGFETAGIRSFRGRIN